MWMQHCSALPIWIFYFLLLGFIGFMFFFFASFYPLIPEVVLWKFHVQKSQAKTQSSFTPKNDKISARSFPPAPTMVGWSLCFSHSSLHRNNFPRNDKSETLPKKNRSMQEIIEQIALVRFLQNRIHCFRFNFVAFSSSFILNYFSLHSDSHFLFVSGTLVIFFVFDFLRK